jgi:hypothetical protein
MECEMTKYVVTITASYLVELENLERDRERITMEYELPVLPDFIPGDDVEFIDSNITYESDIPIQELT